MKILFVDSWDNVGSFFRKKRNENKYTTSVSLYKNNSFLNKIYRFLGIKLYKPLLYFSYGNWKKHLNKYDLYIMESRKTFEYLVKMINRTQPEKRVIVWYWNKVSESEMNPIKIRDKYKCETWSFDRGDALKYNMKYNSTYYFKNDENKDIKKYDVFYIGIDRENRIKQINRLLKMFDELHLKSKIILTKSKVIKPDKVYNYSKPMKYEEVIENIKKSNSIVDLTQNGQRGLTLRPMEALFYNKKLITNNIDIKKYDFYKESNVFIWEKDNTKKLKNFIETPYEKIDDKIKEKYLFDNWIERVIKNEEC